MNATLVSRVSSFGSTGRFVVCAEGVVLDSVGVNDSNFIDAIAHLLVSAVDSIVDMTVRGTMVVASTVGDSTVTIGTVGHLSMSVSSTASV